MISPLLPESASTAVTVKILLPTGLVSTKVTGPGVESVHSGLLSLMSVMVTTTDTVPVSLRGTVPVVTLKACKHPHQILKEMSLHS